MPPLSGKFEVAQYILGEDFKRRMSGNDELRHFVNQELRLLEGFYGLAFDLGLAKISSFEGRNAEPVYMLRRAVGFGKLFADEEDIRSGTLEILRIEVNNADNIASGFIFNKTALEIQISIAEAQASAVTQPEGEDISARYTENEFIIILRNRSEKYRDNLRSKIETKLKAKGISVQIDLIHQPTDSKERDIYMAFLHRSIILTPKQIEKIKSRMESDSLDFAQRSIYPDGVHTIAEKAAYLKKQHDELTMPIKIAQMLDGSEATKRTELTVNFIENILYNKTVGNDVYSFADLQWHIAQGELTEIFIIEFKFLQEINEALSIIDGDAILAKVFQHIKSTVEEADKEKVIYFQRGGVFIVGLPANAKFTDDAKEHIRSSISPVLIHEETQVEVPLGFFELTLTPKPVGETEIETVNRTNNDLNKGLAKVESDWFDQLAALMQTYADEYVSLFGADEWRAEQEMTEEHVMNPSYLVWHFFHGKNAHARCKKILEFLPEGELKTIFVTLLSETF